MQPRDEEALSLWQSYARQSGPIVANAMLSEFLAPYEYTATMDAVRSAMSEVEFCVCTPMKRQSSSSDFSQSASS